MKYEIYDSTDPRLLENHRFEIEAGSPRKALQQYLTGKALGHLKFRNTSDNDVIWKTTPFEIVDGTKYRCGRISWWGLVPERIM